MAATNSALAGARCGCARDVLARLNAGNTSASELAGYGVELSQVISDSWLPGLNIYPAVRILSQTGGRGDAQSLPLEVLCDMILPRATFSYAMGWMYVLKRCASNFVEGHELLRLWQAAAS